MKRRQTVLRSLILLIILCVLASRTESYFARENIIDIGKDKEVEELFNDVVANFKLYNNLLQDIIPIQGYLVPVHAVSINDACSYLSEGWETEIAQAIAQSYLRWEDAIDKLVIIPTDSIPVISAEDRSLVDISFNSDKDAQLTRIYKNCYAEDDSYLYTIKLEKLAERWRITSLSLDEIP